MMIATVRLLDVPYRVDKDYDYRMPEGVALPEVGRILLVPFGRGNRHAYAILVATREEKEEARPLKTVAAVLPEDYRLTPEILRLCFFLREHTLSSVGEAVRAAFPASALGHLREVYVASVEPSSLRKSKKASLLAYIAEHPALTAEELTSALGEDVGATLSALCREGLCERRLLRAPDAAPKTRRYYSLVPEGDARAALLRADGGLNEKCRAV
jgi:primosomal protein N'